jgi:hypothetical protein
VDHSILTELRMTARISPWNAKRARTPAEGRVRAVSTGVKTIFTISVALCSVACMKPNPLIYTLGGSETEGEDETETGDGDGDGDGTSQVSADLPYASCDAAAPYEPACASCLADSCCAVVEACSADDDCVCLATCLLAGGTSGKCKNECGGAKADEIPQLQAMLDCAGGSCTSECN